MKGYRVRCKIGTVSMNMQRREKERDRKRIEEEGEENVNCQDWVVVVIWYRSAENLRWKSSQVEVEDEL